MNGEKHFANRELLIVSLAAQTVFGQSMSKALHMLPTRREDKNNLVCSTWDLCNTEIPDRNGTYLSAIYL